MSLYVKNNPKGIDVPLQHFQTFLFGQLKTKWNLSDADFNCHGRAYKNYDKGNYVPEVFTKGNDYQEVFFDDRLKVLSFFLVGDAQKYAKGMTAPVSMIFMVNVPGLKTSIVHRADEEIRLDVEKLVTQKRNSFTYTGTETGLNNVFKEFTGWKKSSVSTSDTHPRHCFRINFSLLYNID